MKILGFIAVVAAVAATTAALPAAAQLQQTLTFDEVPAQAVNGLTVKGVSFDFRVGGLLSPDARYNALGPGGLAFLSDDSVLEGDAAGLLTLNFANPVVALDFGLALTSFSPLTAAAQVQVFNSTQALAGTFAINTAPQTTSGFSEARFVYSGAPVARLVIDFNETVLDPAFPARFALDNLSLVAIPEPSTLALCLLAGGGALMAGQQRRRRRRLH